MSTQLDTLLADMVRTRCLTPDQGLWLADSFNRFMTNNGNPVATFPELYKAHREATNLSNQH